MKIINEELVSCKISKNYEIELDDGNVLLVNKWIYEDDIETDNDYEIDEKSLESFNKLSEEKQDQIRDFINDITI